MHPIQWATAHPTALLDSPSGSKLLALGVVIAVVVLVLLLVGGEHGPGMHGG